MFITEIVDERWNTLIDETDLGRRLHVRHRETQDEKEGIVVFGFERESLQLLVGSSMDVIELSDCSHYRFPDSDIWYEFKEESSPVISKK